MSAEASDAVIRVTFTRLMRDHGATIVRSGSIIPQKRQPVFEREVIDALAFSASALLTPASYPEFKPIQPPAETFAVILKRVRTAVGLSQSRLAERCGFDHSYISRLESGERTPTRDAVDRIANALSVSEPVRRDLIASAGMLRGGEASAFLLDRADPVIAAALNFCARVVNPARRDVIAELLRQLTPEETNEAATYNVISREEISA